MNTVPTRRQLLPPLRCWHWQAARRRRSPTMRPKSRCLDLREYFNGKIEAHGVSATAMVWSNAASWWQWTAAGMATMGCSTNSSCNSDGERQRRVWRLKHLGDGRYSGRADDVVGVADGSARGNAFRWQYTLRPPVDGKGEYEVQFDDWMYLIDDRVMLNHATMSKFGIKLGEVQLSFYRPR